MLKDILKTEPVSTVALDANSKYTSLLLNGDGTNGAQNQTFIDSSANNATITRYGDTTQGTFSPFGNSWSNYFDGTGDFLSTSTVTALQMDSDFTWEAWVYSISNPSIGNYKTFWAQRTSASGFGGPAVVLDSAGNFLLFISNATASSWAVTSFDTGLDVSLNQWQHIALVKNGTTVTLYKNGIAGTPTTHSTAVGTSGNTTVMAGAADGSQAVDGYISNLRVVKGTALYTSNFTPPTAPLTAVSGTSLLTCQSNRFVDNSTNNATITKNGDVKVVKDSPFPEVYDSAVHGGSMYFDGTGDYLSLPANTNYSFGTGDFTIECWVYLPNNISDSIGIWTNGTATSGAVSCYIRPDRKPEIVLYGYLNLTAITALSTSTWYHFAATRSGSTFRLFINGILENSGTSSANNTTSGCGVGITHLDYTNNYLMSGYISNLRILKGTALTYTPSTLPTAPLSAITNTSLLLKGTNAGIIDATGKNDLVTYGNAQISTSTKKFGTGSMYFDGSGDYLTIPANTNFALGTSDFTIEMWIKTPSPYSNFRSGPVGQTDTFNGRWMIRPRTSAGQLGWAHTMNGSTYADISSGLTLPNDTWCHIAVVRQSGVFKFFLDGVKGTDNSSYISDSLGSSSYPLYIGRNVWDGNVDFTGYIDDLRITKGIARYTGNFTPPTAALTI